MNITCSKDPLLKAVRVAESLLLSKNVGKANVLLDASTDTPCVFSTDSETSVVVHLNAAIDQNGSVVVFGKKFCDILSSLPDKDVQLQVTAENLLKIKTTDKSIKALFSLKGLSRSDYAPLPKITGDIAFHMAQKDLKNMIRKVIFSASSDDMRYVLNGILFNIKRKTLKLVATDGRRLSVVSRDIEGPAQDRNVIVSKKVLAEIEKMLAAEGECQIGVSENQVSFHFDNIHILSRLIEGDFPDYQQVIPASHETTMVFKREELMNAVKRISLLVNDNYKKLTITIKDNKAVFDSQDPDIGEAFEEIPLLSVEPPLKEDFIISFNSFFLMDVLKVTDTENLVFLFNKNINPAVIREKDGEDFLSIIMPMKNT